MFIWSSECHVISALLCGKRWFSLFSSYVLEYSLSCLENRYLSALFIHPLSKICYKSSTSWFPDRSFAPFCTYLISNLLPQWSSLCEGLCTCQVWSLFSLCLSWDPPVGFAGNSAASAHASGNEFLTMSAMGCWTQVNSTPEVSWEWTGTINKSN